MKRLNLTFFTALGNALQPLDDVPSRGEFNTANFRAELVLARNTVRQLVDDATMPLTIPASRSAAQGFLNSAEAALKLPVDQLNEGHGWNIYFETRKLKTLLDGELAVQSVYHIWPKRAFDTNLLIDKATTLFSKDIQAWFNADETYNIGQAGKCIAFETPTAAGFHLVRAAESVIRRYYTMVVGKPPANKVRNWGAYIRNLRSCNADPKVLHALEQIKDLHRNPVIHPEVQLDLEEAISLLGIIESIISAIYFDMRKRADASIPPALPFQPNSGLLSLSTLFDEPKAANE